MSKGNQLKALLLAAYGSKAAAWEGYHTHDGWEPPYDCRVCGRELGTGHNYPCPVHAIKEVADWLDAKGRDDA